MSAHALLRDEVFAGNRAVGRVAFSATATDGMSRRARVHEAGSLRVRFPNGGAKGALDAVIVNTAGGMTGGDRFHVDVTVGARARVNLTTAAAEKIYRSLGSETLIDVKLRIAPGGSLIWLPQETIIFDRVRLRRSIEAELTGDANLVLAEASVFGRSAMGEVLNAGQFFDRRRVRIDGKLVFAETTRLDGAIARLLQERAVAGSGIAVASVFKVPADQEDVAKVRAKHRDFTGEVGVSAWNGFAVARLVAADGAALRRDLLLVLKALDAEPSRLWSN
jgi:urease accessory protein